MRIVIAPDSFKESLSAEQVALAISAGLKSVLNDLETELVPVADGGEGTTEALVAATSGQIFTEQVTDPLGRAIEASWGLLGTSPDGVTTAVVETAAASGLERLEKTERDSLNASSRGTGELILKALDQGARRLILGLGGSATNDGGSGLLSALGVRFYNSRNQEIADGGAALIELDRVCTDQMDPRLSDTEFLIACDVDNPLLGERGASAIFGPQKGASPEQVKQLDEALSVFAKISEAKSGRQDRELKGAGAAGGLGFGLVQYLNARLAPGIDLVLEAVQFNERLVDADLVITGEGQMDGQSLGGKTPIGVARWAQKRGVPVIAFCGSIGPGSERVHQFGIEALFSVVPGVISLESALSNAAENIERTAAEFARVLRVSDALPINAKNSDSH